MKAILPCAVVTQDYSIEWAGHNYGRHVPAGALLYEDADVEKLRDILTKLERTLLCYSDHTEYFGFAVKAELLPILRGEIE